MVNASLNHYVHIYEKRVGPRTVILLHGTGGDEYDLVPLSEQIDPEANILSLRGNEPEHGMNRFFRRFAEGQFDEENIRERVPHLREFLEAAAKKYAFKLADATFIGYSNGANFVAAFMLLQPGVVKSAVLLRAMIPLESSPLPNLTGTRILLQSGRHDQIISGESAKGLAELFKKTHADVTHIWQEAGHNLIQKDLDDARSYLE